MKTDKDPFMEEIFKTHKFDISDEGFTDRVMRSLPGRSSLLSQLIMLFSVIIGMVLTVAIIGADVILSNLSGLITAVASVQVPTIPSVLVYTVGLMLISLIGYSISQVEMEI